MIINLSFQLSESVSCGSKWSSIRQRIGGKGYGRSSFPDPQFHVSNVFLGDKVVVVLHPARMSLAILGDVKNIVVFRYEFIPPRDFLGMGAIENGTGTGALAQLMRQVREICVVCK
jgi:hypothetical protein